MEIAELYFHRYELTPKSAPNRLTEAKVRQGCLLKIRFKDSNSFGHADLFPWPELGDEPLDIQLQALKEGVAFRQSAAALSWAFYESQAFDKNVALITDAAYPSHATLSDRTKLPADFSTAKLKISSADIEQWRSLETFMLRFPQLLWRLDFNGLFSTITEASDFWKNVSDGIKGRIEFLEDPYTPELMADPVALNVFTGTDVAVDRHATPESLALAQVWVIKPVYFAPDYLFSEAENFEGKIAITSNMDHPLGQIIALHAAQRLQKSKGSRLLPGGLLTQNLYQTHDAQNWVKALGDKLQPSFSGLGWGFEKQLHNLAWTKA